MLLPMPKVVFKMIALGFEAIVIFIFGFPATSTGSDDLGNGISAETMVRDKCIAIEYLSIRLSGNHQFTPVDQQGGLGVPNRHEIDIAIVKNGWSALMALPDLQAMDGTQNIEQV